MTYIVAFFILTILSAVTLVGIVFLLICYGIAHIRKKTNSKQLIYLKKTVVFFVAVVILNMGLIIISQFTASTPPIDAENSISELIKIDLNGRKQWISLRGRDKSAPVLLFLAGGPGGTQMAAVRHELRNLKTILSL